MVRRCILCCSASNTHKDVSFHQFPKNEIIRSIWIDSLSIKEVVKDWHRICSTHFSPDHYTFKNERKILKLGAIPKMKEMKVEVGSCETSLDHDVNLMSNSLIEVDCCPDIDISNESAPSTSKSLIEVDCCPDIDISNESAPSTSKSLIEVDCCPDIDISNESAPSTSKSLIEVDCCPDIDIFNESAPSTSKRKEVKDKVGSCETSLEHDVNLMSNSLIEVDCCPDIDISNESAPSTSKRLKSPSKNTKKKKKTYKVVNSKEVTSPMKSNKCIWQTSDKEDSINETPQSVDKDVEIYASNNYVGEDGGKKLEVFDSLDDHTSEYRTMTDTGIYSGQYCNQTSNNAYGDKNVLSENTPLQCDFCLKTFEYRCNLLVHRRTHTGEKPYGCDVCGLAFMMKSHLVRHQRTHTGEKPCVCDVCGKSFPDEGTLVKHNRTHTGEKPYECDVCGQSFSERGNLVRHKRTHPTSNNAYDDKNVLTGNTPLQCDFTVTGEKKYECDVCGLAFHILSKLVRHQRKHTGEKPYACDVCGKSFSQQNHLVAHNRTHTGEKPYVCDVCNLSFSEKKHLVTHNRTHTGEKPYACDVCGKSFSHRHNLVTHNRTHTGEKPYACNVCYRSFSEKGSLVKHNRTHTGERPYECGQCGKKFSTSRDCKRHTLSVHIKKKK